MCEEVAITSKLLDITKILAESNISFSISLNFTIKDKEFQLSASSSKKDQEHPVLQKKRKKVFEPRGKKSQAFAWIQKEKQKPTNNSESLKKSDNIQHVTLAQKDDLSAKKIQVWSMWFHHKNQS